MTWTQQEREVVKRIVNSFLLKDEVADVDGLIRTIEGFNIDPNNDKEIISAVKSRLPRFQCPFE